MKRKNNDDAVKLAASIMGKKGGKSRSEKKIAASKNNIQKALSVLSDEDRRGTYELRRAAQFTIPEEDRISRAKTAVSERWKKYQKESLVKRPIDNDRFRSLSAGIPAREIAEGMGISIAAVNSWRRLKNPVPISAENGKKFLAWFKERKHADLHID